MSNPPPSPEIFALLAQARAQNQPVAFCIVIDSQGSTPRHTGSKMLVYENGSIAGTIGGGELENRVRQAAHEALQDGKIRRLAYNMADPARGDPGVFGGQVEVFIEPILPPPWLLVVGGGHVGKAVAHLAKWLGYRVAVSDDRPEFCTPAEHPDADAFYPVPMSEIPQRLSIDQRTSIVLTTRGVDVDVQGLPALLETPAAYIGVIGSRRRWAATARALKARGVSDQALARIHSPIGLELHAETPEEIAVSIMAEILMLRNAATGQPMRRDPANRAATLPPD